MQKVTEVNFARGKADVCLRVLTRIAGSRFSPKKTLLETYNYFITDLKIKQSRIQLCLRQS